MGLTEMEYRKFHGANDHTMANDTNLYYFNETSKEIQIKDSLLAQGAKQGEKLFEERMAKHAEDLQDLK